MNDAPDGAERGSLVERIGATPLAIERECSAERLDELLEVAWGEAPELAGLIEASEPLRKLLLGAIAGSPYLDDLITRDCARLLRILTSAPQARLADAIAQLGAHMAACEDQGEAMRLLRAFKAETALTIALADLAGIWQAVPAMRALSDAADAALDETVRFLLRRAAQDGRFTPPDPADAAKGSGFVVLAMGKHGARELNFSSDIDLIVLYDPDIAPLAEGVEPSTFFVRITKGIVKLLQERNADGYGYRVDLRLRPDPGATAVAISLPAALQYYESMGQNWERAALIKARPVAGDIAAGNAFLKDIAPFIWRKYLDFAAIMDVHAMKRQIHAHKGHAAVAVAGHNIKLGRGGIREIEFFVQTQQLIAGGRQPDLRGRETLAMLETLAETGWIAPQAQHELAESYCVLRWLEHRLQMMRDEQTHTLPQDEDALAAYAAFCGFGERAAFDDMLRGHLRRVEQHYAALFEEAPALAAGTGSLVFTGGEDDPDTVETLRRLGYEQPGAVTATIRGWHFGRYPATRSGTARERLTELTPALLEALAKTDNPQSAFLTFDQFLAGLPAGVQFFSLLRAHPELLALFALMMGAAPRLTAILGRRVHVLDAVLAPGFFGGVPSPDSLATHLDISLGEAQGYEDVLDRARRFGQEQAFLIGLRILSGTVTASQAGQAFAQLASLLVDRLCVAAAAELARAHGAVPGGMFAVLAMGKLGGEEMTASSDLDLILIYDHPAESEQSDGPRPLSATAYYMRLTQRIVAAVSAPTAEGRLYDVDLRLRPSGSAGPVATSLQSFRAYHEDSAWSWEHMALTRARVISGAPALRATVEDEIRQVLRRPRDKTQLVADILDIRRRLHEAKGSNDPWALKIVPGGLVDVEFIAQFLQLIHANQMPGVLDQNTAQALRELIAARALDPEAGETLLRACALYHNLTQVLRLALDKDVPLEQLPAALKDRLVRAAGLPDFATLDAHLRDCQAAVRKAFLALIGAGAWGDVQTGERE